MRLQRAIHVDKPVESITLRISTHDLPASATVRITDVQLQPGQQPTGVVPNPQEHGTIPQQPHYRNGIVMDGLEIVALSNADQAIPTRLEVRGHTNSTRIGSYRFGKLQGTAIVDATQGTATQGYGRPPIITERADLTLRTYTDNRAHLRLHWQERKNGTP